MESPIGEMVIAARETTVCALEFVDQWVRAERHLRRRRSDVIFVEGQDPAGAHDRLQAYFAGELAALHELSIDPDGTSFQRQVWNELRRIPPGRTITYRQLAERVNCPSGFRAVGNANRLNPMAILIPCHRVIGADGELLGYAGGLDRKRWLLAHEARHSGLRSVSGDQCLKNSTSGAT
jgi:methylated-DNA-[protein]-cysteine S-methyltransferase